MATRISLSGFQLVEEIKIFIFCFHYMQAQKEPAGRKQRTKAGGKSLATAEERPACWKWAEDVGRIAERSQAEEQVNWLSF
jgi:hypothetical protein